MVIRSGRRLVFGRGRGARARGLSGPAARLIGVAIGGLGGRRPSRAACRGRFGCRCGGQRGVGQQFTDWLTRFSRQGRGGASDFSDLWVAMADLAVWALAMIGLVRVAGHWV